MIKRTPAVQIGAVICFGLALRCLWWAQHPVINSPDTIVYLADAEALFSTGLMESNTYMPLYPILLHFAGENGIVALQIVLSSASIYLVYRLSIDVWCNRMPGLIAATTTAVHPMLIYYSTLRLTETVFIFFLLLGFALMYRGKIVLASIVFVVANLTRPSLDLIFPFIIVAGSFATLPKPHLAVIAKRLAIYASVYCAMMSPWWIHNYQKYHQFVRLDLAGGMTMLLENNEQFEQIGLDLSKLTPWAPLANISNPVQLDSAMREEAVGYIVSHPSQWLSGTADRSYRFFTPNDLKFSSFQQRFGAIVFAFMIAGAFVSLFYSSCRTFPLWIPIVFLTALHLSFHAVARYRLPLDPLLIILASGTFARGFIFLRSSD